MERRESIQDLLEIRKILEDEIVEINKTIEIQQIVKQSDLIKLGYKLKTNGTRYFVYESITSEIVLDITKPDMVIISHLTIAKDRHQLTFYIKTLQELITLLKQLRFII